MVHIPNGISLNHKKEPIWVSANEKDEPGAYYTEWSKSEREKQMCVNTQIKKNKCCVLTHKCRLCEDGADEQDSDGDAHSWAGRRWWGWTSGPVARQRVRHHMQTRHPAGSALGPQELKPGLWDSRGGVGGGWEAVAQRWLIRAGARQGPARRCRATPPQSSKC